MIHALRPPGWTPEVSPNRIVIVSRDPSKTTSARSSPITTGSPAKPPQPQAELGVAATTRPVIRTVRAVRRERIEGENGATAPSTPGQRLHHGPRQSPA
jgi:hypothetical protein